MSSPANENGNGNNLQLEMNTDMRSAVRFPAWIGLAVFSGICLAAATSELDKDMRGSQEKWTIAVCSISMCLSILAILGYILVRGIFMGSAHLEGVMILIALGFWGFGIPTIMGPDNNIAVLGDSVKNANLYFFSWISLAVCVYISLSLLQDVFGLDARQALGQGKQARWFFLVASSAVVLGVAARIHKSDTTGCGEAEFKDTNYCRRNKYAIALGTISSLFAIVMTTLMFRKFANALLEMVIVTVLLIMWSFGVGFITFGGTSSPGTTIGNLYFATWISFVLCVVLFSSTLGEFMGMAPQQQQQQQSTTSTNGTHEDHEEQDQDPSLPTEDYI